MMSNISSLQRDLEYIFDKSKLIADHLNNKTILITGGTGFIGKWLLEYFIWLNDNKAIDLKIIVLSRNPAKFVNDFPQFSRQDIRYIEGNVIDFKDTEKSIDYIIHAAADSDAMLNKKYPLQMIDTIVQGTRRMLDFAAAVKASRFLYLSSGAVYGIPSGNIASFEENYSGAPDVLNINSAYGESKRMAEVLCTQFQERTEMDIVIARCFAFVGPYLPLDKHFAIGNFINNILKNEDIIIKGTGKPQRSYMYASDLVVWLLYCLFKGERGDAYNVGSDQPVSIRELAELTASFGPGLNVKILGQDNPSDRSYNYVPDTSKIRAELHVPEIISLPEAILKTLNFHLNK